ncbi:MAG: thioredoxin domain-containing protein [Elusimicrobia bacterium]|nr:thioredoxin domain-containing protein [Elusimicrobiota bacterium]
MKVRAWLLPLTLLAGTTLHGAELSRDELKKALQANPDLVLDVLRQNKKAFFEVVTQAAQEEQTRRQKEQEEAQTKELDERIKNPFKPAVTNKSLVRGNRKAKLTLVEYSDFQCPYCSRGYETVEALRKKYGDKLRVVFKNKPLPFHPQAMPAAQWLVAASLQSQEKAWAFHDQLFQNQAKLGDAFFKEAAKSAGLDVAKLEKDAQSQAVKDAIEADIKEATDFGFEGTPGFLINGVPVRGAYPIEHFDMIIQKLEAAGK